MGRPSARRRSARGVRRAATRRNRVWQMDFFEFETSGGGTWRSGDVIDYATKYVLAGPVTATSTARDAIDSLQLAIAEAERLLRGPLLDELTDPETGELTPVIVVTDNGQCFKSRTFERFIDSRPELTRRNAAPVAADQRRDRALPRRDQRSSTSGATCHPTAPRCSRWSPRFERSTTRSARTKASPAPGRSRPTSRTLDHHQHPSSNTPSCVRFLTRDIGAGGRNFCLGAALAKLELRILVEETVRRFPQMMISDEATYAVSQFASQLRTLPVRLHG